jgi:hypothetical protein
MTIYVDNKLSKSCFHSYSVSQRDSSGSDGDAYKTIVEAANLAKVGDTVLIREGTYHSESSLRENDVLWPKSSGEPGKPIVFKAYNGEKVVLGESPEFPDSAESSSHLSSLKHGGLRGRLSTVVSWVANPSSLVTDPSELSIARCAVTLKNVRYIEVEGLEFKNLAGWVFARGCDHITFRNCVFEDALNGFKGTAHLLECRDCRFLGCSFRNSTGDSLALEKCDRTLVENCKFESAAHALLAIRGSSYNVIRHCSFKNPYFVNQRAEKLLEVYDLKLDRREPANPAYVQVPAYNSTRRNLLEYNFFGYHPFRPNSAAQPSAIQYSGQSGIIRRNIFSNPPLKKPDPDYPAGVAGGIGMNMRWGGSWEGWKVKVDGTGFWLGEAHEAGYVTDNRVYNNTFFGYDQSCITIPGEDGMNKALDPPPMNEANPPQQFGEKFAFRNNLFLNNVMVPGRYQFHVNWTWQKELTGKPVAVTALGLLKEVRFQNNDFYADADNGALVYVRQDTGKTPAKLISWGDTQFDKKYPKTFMENLQKDPLFVNPQANDFHLKDGSPMLDAGAFLTRTTGSGADSNEVGVEDPMFFYDGFGIEGESGDLIQLKGQKDTARVVRIDYQKKTLKVDRPLSWKDGQEIGLAYSGTAPDIGALEQGMSTTVGLIEAGASEH